MDDEDKVVTLLANLPESYNVLVTALEASNKVHAMEVVLERVLHEMRKQNDRDKHSNTSQKVTMMSKEDNKPQEKKKAPKYYHCAKIGHIR